MNELAWSILETDTRNTSFLSQGNLSHLESVELWVKIVWDRFGEIIAS